MIISTVRSHSGLPPRNPWPGCRQPLILCAQFSVLPLQVLDHVQEKDDAFAHTFILNSRQVEIIQWSQGHFLVTCRLWHNDDVLLTR